MNINEVRTQNSIYFDNLHNAVESGILTKGEALKKSTLKKNKIIKEHEKHHSIFLASDGRWKTRLPDGNGKGKMVAKKNVTIWIKQL